MPEIIRAEYSIVTPMFIGDANQQVTGISPVSFKGALQYWWRALSWSKCRNKQQSDDAALQALHQKEGHIFGSSTEPNARQAKFNLRINIPKLPPPKADWPKSQSDSGYLGMGLWESGSKERNNFQAAREYISEGTNFTVEAIIHPSLAAEDIQSLKDAFTVLGLLGGLGSRSRRAFGSIALQSLNDESYQFDSQQAYKAKLNKLLSNYKPPKTLPLFTAISQQTQIGISSQTKATARLAHAELGHLFREHRGQPSNLRGSKKRVFGMPYSGGGAKESKARRASPLLMHIHPVAGQYCITTTFIPAVFHHDKALETVDYNLIRSFICQFDEVTIA